MRNKKMIVEIWSDIMCPFCYIGKRKFEKALEQFSFKNEIQIEWKSFQLNPQTVTDTTKTVYQYLAEHKGISLEESKKMNDYVSQIASDIGLEFNFDHAIVANSFNAHRLLHFAKSKQLQHEAEELLFKSYFTDGKNVDDISTLIALGEQIGLNEMELKEVLENDTYTEEVRMDIYEAQQLRINSVPFFVFDRKYGVSGAQEPETFLKTLESSFTEWKSEN